jgi:hypothetical protein
MKDLSVSTANWKNVNATDGPKRTSTGLKFQGRRRPRMLSRNRQRSSRFYFWCGVIVVATVAIVKAIR